MSARRRSRLRRLRKMVVPVAPIVTFAAGTYGGASASSDGTTVGLQGMPDRRTMAHELAHNLDAQVLTDSDRARFSRIMGAGNKPWDSLEPAGGSSAPGTMKTRHDSTSERFADMVAMLQTEQFPQPGKGGGFAYLDNPPKLRTLLRFGRTLERLQARNHLQTYDSKAIREQALAELLKARKAGAARRR